MKIKVKDSGSLYRDEESGAILNCSNSEYDSYLKLKKQKIEEGNEMDKLKNDVDELKDMMKLILSKLDK
ncbi:MAG: hypothetical protein CMK23_04195 [Porticoccaceae bacterium]|mgnify:FL=1|jgi:hypothetical protein|nr:hypothetical protein [Porticoccaceae bacterium]|tara:strand:+ start:1431 stop:1637 length:207 start_codon:yes stop_codon:yes gene_type:complete